MATATPSIYLDTRTTTENGKHPLKLRITYQRVRRYYSIKSELRNPEHIFLSPLEFKIVSKGIENSKDLKEANLTKPKNFKYSDSTNLIEDFADIKKKANEIIRSLPTFTFNKFKEKFLGISTDYEYLHKAFKAVINDLESKSRLSYSYSLNSTLTNIIYFAEDKKVFSYKKPKAHEKFEKYKSIMIADIDKNWLEDFRAYLQDNKKSVSTIGIHERNIRMIFNKALSEDVKADYPFKNFKPNSSSNKKRPLTIEQIRTIKDYQPDTENNIFYRDLFLFSLFGNGINIGDALRLKHGDIKNNKIEFERHKTKKAKPITIQIALSEPIKQIIKRHSNITLNKDAYLFPILDNEMSEEQIYNKIKYVIKKMNKLLKQIAKDSDFDEELCNSISSYYARHSYATLLKNNNVSIAEISESLGHNDIRTTQKYLSSIDDEQREKTATKLANIINGVG